MKQTILINAIIWAVVILVTAFLYKDSANYSYLFATLIMGAAFSNALLTRQLKASKSCLKK